MLITLFISSQTILFGHEKIYNSEGAFDGDRSICIRSFFCSKAFILEWVQICLVTYVRFEFGHRMRAQFQFASGKKNGCPKLPSHQNPAILAIGR